MSATRSWLGWTDRGTRDLPREPPPETTGDVPQVLRARFAEAAGGVRLAERFDDLAARLYYETDDPRITSDQEEAIRRLRERRVHATATPLVTSYEQQDPHFGKWTTSLLTFEDYGDFKFVNNSYVHLNNPPTTIPPPMVDVHVCWGARFAGAADASVLHGVAALIVDDWRHALHDVQVRFHLHRLGPVPQTLPVGRGGRRWRDRRLSRLPPSEVVGAFFARANRALALQPFDVAEPRVERSPRHGAASRPRAARLDTGRHAWWCACLLEADLPALGFQRGPARLSSPDTVTWTATSGRSGLPSHMEHVFVIPVKESPGACYRVASRGGAIVLDPQRVRREDVGTAGWHRLRVHALDVILDELQKRMR